MLYATRVGWPQHSPVTWVMLPVPRLLRVNTIPTYQHGFRMSIDILLWHGYVTHSSLLNGENYPHKSTRVILGLLQVKYV